MGDEQPLWLHAKSVDAWFGPMPRSDIEGERGDRIRALYEEGEVEEVEDTEFGAAQARKARRVANRAICEVTKLPESP